MQKLARRPRPHSWRCRQTSSAESSPKWPTAGARGMRLLGPRPVVCCTSNRTALPCCSRRLRIAGAPALTQDDRVGEQARRGRPGTPGPLASQRACRACPSFLGKAQTAARKSFIASADAAPCRQAVAHRQTVSPLARHRTHIDVFEGSEDRESRRL